MKSQKDVINQKDFPNPISAMKSQKDGINQKDFPNPISGVSRIPDTFICSTSNPLHKGGREGGGWKVTLGIIISENKSNITFLVF